MLFSKFQLYFPVVTYQCPQKFLPASLDPASTGPPSGPAWFPCVISSRVEMRLKLLGPQSHPAWGGHRNRHVPGRPLQGPRPSLWLCLGNYRSLGFRFRVCTSAGRGTLPQVVHHGIFPTFIKENFSPPDKKNFKSFYRIVATYRISTKDRFKKSFCGFQHF